ncbi:hypothetical protein SK128_022273, partial [Halocaridina rubra]
MPRVKPYRAVQRLSWHRHAEGGVQGEESVKEIVNKENKDEFVGIQTPSTMLSKGVLCVGCCKYLKR